MNERQGMAYHISSFENGGLLLEGGSDFDLIFLDIQMEQPDGMETARKLRQRGNRSLLVFVTVLKEFVFDAFEVEAYDYLVKPLDDLHFKRTMDRAMQSLTRQKSQSILIRRGNSCQVVLLSRIVYCEVLGRKIYIHQREGKVTEYYDKMERLRRSGRQQC